MADLEKSNVEKSEEIGILKEQLASTNSSLATLIEMYRDKSQLADMQRNEMNTAYYAVGTAKELKENGVLTKEGGLVGIGGVNKLNTDSLPKDYFTRSISPRRTRSHWAARRRSSARRIPKEATAWRKAAAKLVILDARQVLEHLEVPGRGDRLNRASKEHEGLPDRAALSCHGCKTYSGADQLWGRRCEGWVSVWPAAPAFGRLLLGPFHTCIACSLREQDRDRRIEGLPALAQVRQLCGLVLGQELLRFGITFRHDPVHTLLRLAATRAEVGRLLFALPSEQLFECAFCSSVRPRALAYTSTRCWAYRSGPVDAGVSFWAMVGTLSASAAPIASSFSWIRVICALENR